MIKQKIETDAPEVLQTYSDKPTQSKQSKTQKDMNNSNNDFQSHQEVH